jgi:hypothetical protein
MGLTNALSDSISEIRKLVREHHALLQEIANNTRNTRRTHAPNAPASILGVDDADESIFSQLIDAKDDEQAGFESEIFKSKVYADVFTGVLRSDGQDNESDDARTIIETEPISPITTPAVKPIPSANVSAAPTRCLAVKAPEIKSSVKNLGIRGIKAYCLFEHIARSDDETSFKWRDAIKDLKQLTRSRYCGTVEGTTESWGQFDRNLVYFQLSLRRPRTVRALHKPLGKPSLGYEEGHVLVLDVSTLDPMLAVIADPKPDYSAQYTLVGTTTAKARSINEEPAGIGLRM